MVLGLNDLRLEIYIGYQVIDWRVRGLLFGSITRFVV